MPSLGWELGGLGNDFEQTRVLADSIADPKARKMMLGIAEGYERLAERAAQRARTNIKQDGP
jgi:hypothetical protein